VEGSASIDPTNDILSSFLEENGAMLEERAKQLAAQVFAPLRVYSPSKMGADRSYRVLSTCVGRALGLLEEVCSKKSIDFWFAYVRRLPGLVLDDWPPEWRMYATLSILKWSNWLEDTTGGRVAIEQGEGVVLSASEEDLTSCCDIATVARLVAECNSLRRWVGKGARLVWSGEGHPTLDKPKEVQVAVDHYERRRPDEYPILADEGLLAVDFVHNLLIPPSTEKPFPLYVLGKPRPPLDVIRLTRTEETFQIQYMLRSKDPEALLNAILPYGKPIEDLFHCSVNAVMQVLHAIGLLALTSMPVPTGDDDFSFDGDLADDPDFRHRLRFMLQLCRRGFLRMSEVQFRDALSQVVVPPYSHSSARAKQLVDLFFDRLQLDDKGRRGLDVERLEPIPIAYKSPGGACFVDLLAVDDFMRWLVRRGKEWYPSQHGDQFPVDLKMLVEQRTKARVLSPRERYEAPTGEQAQIDLVILAGQTLYAIECKAHAKSREFWLGKPSARGNRDAKIKEAVDQARDAAKVLEAVRRAGDPEIPATASVEWLVCMPSQEYLCPFDRYGTLTPNIPRLCTPDELVLFLNPS